MALDLTRDVPRSPFDELAGFPWLPRMIDKARAMVAGTLGEYSPFPCPGDQLFLRHFGVDAAAFAALIKADETDEAIAAWVAANAKRSDEAAKAAFRQEQRGPHRNPFFTLVAKMLAWKHRGAIAAHSPTVDWRRLNSLARVIAAEEGHPE